ncbi:RNA-binding protein MEX3B [Thrips palmi]|uniref:RNA-binding protein MEX3B n=1 Tax=Thrips palmi TaxID=161013 RepID=A0A6P8Z908_THRPL|nr:RNA-binding protein MEX3B [Thrips palmi]
MPASSLFDMDRPVSGALEDQRALHLAFELSRLNLASDHHNINSVSDSLDQVIIPTAFPEETRSKKSQNMTECVPVPSSEHVAEIVGRQGCKIKALRAKTNTYIKTPVRGEEPVFVVTGRKEDVAKAKREILSAAEHFSQIRASRKNNLSGLGGSAGSLSPPGPPSHVPGQVTIQVRVPYRVVGLVVGPKGATIKRIQHQTSTYIVTPSRDKEPVFEVTGLPESVDAARRQIEAHIAVRTGASGSMGTELFEDSTDMLTSLYSSPGLNNLFNTLEPSNLNSLNSLMNNASTEGGVVSFAGLTSSTGSSGAFSSAGSCSSSSSGSTGGGSGRLNDLVNIWNSSSVDRDEGLGESPSFESAMPSSNIWSFQAASTTASANLGTPLGTDLVSRPSPSHSASPTESLHSLGSLGGILGHGRNSPTKRDCMVCGEREVVAALVPCGHNLFCMECANGVCDSSESNCPQCQQTVCQAIRIRS